MNKSVLIIGTALMTFSAQGAILLDDVIAIDFGNTATTVANWNTSVIADVADLARLSDGSATGVGMTITTVGGNTSANNAVFSDGSAQGGSTEFDIYDDGIIMAGTGNDEITLTFTGLDDALTYDLSAGGQAAASFGATWTIGSLVEDTNFQDTDSYVSFANVSSVGGEITLVINDLSDGRSPASGRNIGLSELTLTAVPEPSSSALLGLGGLALLARRRR